MSVEVRSDFGGSGLLRERIEKGAKGGLVLVGRPWLLRASFRG